MERSLIKPQRLKGFHDYLPDVAKLRIDIIRVCQDVSLRFGFNPTRVPSIEYSEVLLGEGGETDKQVYRFIDNGERDVALRYDMTVPFARYVAEHYGELTFPFKRCEAGQVFRAEKPQKGRLREFGQCDVDIIGVDSVAADSEVLLTLGQILEEIDFGNFTVFINHRDLLSGIIRYFAPHLSPEQETSAIIIIDKLDKIGAPGVVEQLQQNLAFDSGKASSMVEMLSDSFDAVKSKPLFKEILEQQSQARLGYERLQQLLNRLRHCHQGSNGKYTVNLAIARGLAYYTGIVFESTIDQLPNFGSVCSGGRYNNLAGRFSKQVLPGVGGSVGTDRLLEAILEMHEVSGNVAPEIYIAVASEDAETYGFELAMRLRQMQYCTDINVASGKKLGNQIKQAVKAGAKLAVIVGGDEMKANTYVVKDLAKEEEHRNFTFHQLLQFIQECLNADTGGCGAGGCGSGGCGSK